MKSIKLRVTIFTYCKLQKCLILYCLFDIQYTNLENLKIKEIKKKNIYYLMQGLSSDQDTDQPSAH